MVKTMYMGYRLSESEMPKEQGSHVSPFSMGNNFLADKCKEF